jgi:hypothetical protein
LSDRRLIVLTLRYASYLLILNQLGGCYFFRKKSTGKQAQSVAAGAVIGQSIGNRAGGANEQALQEVYGVSSDVPPAAIRPDPDTVVRNLLLQYREQGATVAREIGRVEQYRLLLGGATEDFSKPPQDSYDATSLLAIYQVAEEVCVGLVAPDSRHPGWQTILPHAVSDVRANIGFLTQRITGQPTEMISDETLNGLEEILEAQSDGAVELADYVPVCAALVVDAEALLL